MNRTQYILRQLSRTYNKKFENYIITKIFHDLNDSEIKFVTQQYVLRPDGYALTDLYFPQIEFHIEINEEGHKNRIEADKIREEDIINATGHEIKTIEVWENDIIEKINAGVKELLYMIREKIDQVKIKGEFIPWDYDKELSSETYLKLGYIDLKDKVAFNTIADACNCFGYNYKSFQKGGVKHPREKDVLLWFPKLYPNKLVENSISDNDNIITEKIIDCKKRKEHVNRWRNNIITKRIVFARVKSNLGDIMYRFKGIYEIEKEKSNEVNGLVWKRIATRVKTYRSKN